MVLRLSVNRPPAAREPTHPGMQDSSVRDCPGPFRERSLRWRRVPGDVDELVPLQRELLTSALRLVRPGGVVVYSTCSPHPAETIGVVDAVCAATGAEQIDARPFVATDGMDFPVPGPGPQVQLWPPLPGTDALFLLVRTPEGIRLVARSVSERIDAAQVAAQFGGGGHGRAAAALIRLCLLYTSPSPRDRTRYRMPSSACKKTSQDTQPVLPHVKK